MGWGVQPDAPASSTPGKDPVSILQEAGWAPGPVWRAENLVPIGIRSQTVQPVVSHYTDWTIRPTHQEDNYLKLLHQNHFVRTVADGRYYKI